MWIALQLIRLNNTLFYGNVCTLLAVEAIRGCFLFIPFVINCFFLDHITVVNESRNNLSARRSTHRKNGLKSPYVGVSSDISHFTSFQNARRSSVDEYQICLPDISSGSVTDSGRPSGKSSKTVSTIAPQYASSQIVPPNFAKRR
jgi:hypothetical protein